MKSWQRVHGTKALLGPNKEALGAGDWLIEVYVSESEVNMMGGKKDET